MLTSVFVYGCESEIKLPKSFSEHVEIICKTNLAELKNGPREIYDKVQEKHSKKNICECMEKSIPEKDKNDPEMKKLYEIASKYREKDISQMTQMQLGFNELIIQTKFATCAY
jgi:hypothetical protein